MEINKSELCQCGCGKSSGVYPKTSSRKNQIKGAPRRFIRGHHTRKSRPSIQGVLRDGNACVLIPLTQGFWALILEEDYPLIEGFCWYYDGGYAWRCEGRARIGMHQVVFGGRLPDHRNGDPLDNRRTNLRPASTFDNSHNRKLSAKNTSGYRGIYFEPRIQKYRVRICVKYKEIGLGSYALLDEAIAARRAAETRYYGDFRREAA